ncbi:MAG TPA: DoxX family protein [Gemmatimonadales bacterium]|nr:DoxX family protein [Gemmatimonadales bacterium]
MTAIVLQAPVSRAQLWTGRVLTTIATLFLCFDAGIHIANPPFVVQASTQMGFPAQLMPDLGVIVVVSLALYLWERTAFFGALLLTAYLGGATALQVRVGSPAFEVLFPAIFATLLWAGLVLRDRRVRALVTGS